MSAFRIPVHYQLCLDIGTAATVNIPYLIILATKYGVSFQYFLFYSHIIYILFVIFDKKCPSITHCCRNYKNHIEIKLCMYVQKHILYIQDEDVRINVS